MAQVTEVFQSEKPFKRVTFVNEDVVLAAAAAGTSIFEIDVRGCERLFAHVRNTHASVAFDAFVIEGKATEDSDEAWTDLTSEADVVLNAPSTTLAAVTSGYILMNVRGLAKVRARASSNTSAGSASVWGGAT